MSFQIIAFKYILHIYAPYITQTILDAVKNQGNQKLFSRNMSPKGDLLTYISMRAKELLNREK